MLIIYVQALGTIIFPVHRHQGDQIGRLFTLGSVLNITEVTQNVWLLVFVVPVMYVLYLTKN
jgi:hypothetical protein